MSDLLFFDSDSLLSSSFWTTTRPSALVSITLQTFVLNSGVEVVVTATRSPAENIVVNARKAGERIIVLLKWRAPECNLRRMATGLAFGECYVCIASRENEYATDHLH